MARRISVVIPTYRRPDCLARCLESLARQRRFADEVIVVGQADDRETEYIVKRQAIESDGRTEWLYVHNEKPDMMAAYNEGIARASGEVVAFTDDDATPHPDWLEVLEPWFDDPHVGAVGGPNIDYFNGRANPTYAKKVGRLIWYGRYIANHGCLTDGPQRVHFLRGCNMSFRRAALTHFPNVLRPYWSANEILVCGAARRKRYEVIYDPAIRVDHYPEERERHDRFAYRSESEWRRTLARNSAHNFVYAVLSSIPVIQMAIFLAYDILVGNRRSPGFVRGLFILAEGRRGEFIERFGPAMKGKLLGIRTYLEQRLRRTGSHV